MWDLRFFMPRTLAASCCLLSVVNTLTSTNLGELFRLELASRSDDLGLLLRVDLEHNN
jgi:hypothetical protein